MAEDNEFEFNYCPECGSENLRWPFAVIVLSGRFRRCESCGKDWQAIWYNAKDYKGEEDEEQSAS